MTTSSELIIVTGASTGIGAATVRELGNRGFHVLAGVRRERDGETIRTANVEPVILDITDSAQIAALTDRIGDRTVRALVNNAGIAVNAPVEALPLDAWRRQFDVNLFGHIAMTQALLPALLRSKGRVVNISSIGGRIALPTYGAYAGTKFAMEGMSDALRREMAPHGVQVVVVEPGGVKTEMAGRGAVTASRLVEDMTPEQHRRYDGLVQAILSHSAAFTEAGETAEKAARVVARATLDRKPRTRYTIGRDAAMMSRLSRVLPDRVLDRILLADVGKHYPK